MSEITKVESIEDALEVVRFFDSKDGDGLVRTITGVYITKYNVLFGGSRCAERKVEVRIHKAKQEMKLFNVTLDTSFAKVSVWNPQIFEWRPIYEQDKVEDSSEEYLVRLKEELLKVAWKVLGYQERP